MTYIPNTALGLRAWANEIGPVLLSKVLDEANITTLYFACMASYTKPCTPATCERIERACRAHKVGVVPDYETCTRPSVRAAAQRAKQAAKGAAQVAELQAAEARAAERSGAATA